MYSVEEIILASSNVLFSYLLILNYLKKNEITLNLPPDLNYLFYNIWNVRSSSYVTKIYHCQTFLVLPGFV
ncbi:uncharacterized protein Smp_202000 [Schistosoma mansoni]|uniref:uncharacterized protein n=1 Tax=Schistosoma mansoni TaxID=6183 RepID=UPI00022DBF8C|nr:uncharacterized protein Smp_202000 [Schistosoma mansoni]|eukprot:XP_018650811.1 uncharacterized protein Smp_202000 [Schistosoma mansoni]